MKIIDFIIHGNQVKFFLGADNCENYWGDDWDDRPYEHNAGTVYDEFVEAYFIKTFNWGFLVREPADGAMNGNSNYSKLDMKKRIVPCVVAVDEDYHDSWDDSFSAVVGNDNAIKYYFGDKVDETKEDIVYLKERKHQNLYIEFDCNADEKMLDVISHTIGTSLKYMANNKYLKEFDNVMYKNIEDISEKEYKVFFRDSIKNLCALYNINNTKDIVSSLSIKLIKEHDIKTNENQKYYICCQSDNNFDIGEVKKR